MWCTLCKLIVVLSSRLLSMCYCGYPLATYFASGGDGKEFKTEID